MTITKNQTGHIENLYGAKTNGLINYSSLTSYTSQKRSEHYSIKYVIDGQEEYLVDGQYHVLTSGQFLIIKPDQVVHAAIQAPKAVHGICIYLSPVNDG